jgi:hypothetical protein
MMSFGAIPLLAARGGPGLATSLVPGDPSRIGSRTGEGVMARRKMSEAPRMSCIAAISLALSAFLYGGANAQVNAERQIHCVIQRPGNRSGPIDVVVDFTRNTINGAPADGRFRREQSGDLNAYSIFSANFIMNVQSWADESGQGGVRSLNYITIDRIHSAIRATTVPMPGGRSTSNRGDCSFVAAP